MCGEDWLPVWQEAPIYDRLIGELGDVPTQVRREAERVLRELEQVMRLATPLSGGLPQQMWPPSPRQ
ncbi:hypothetical protein [Streptomyces albipurpureus]|uniref:Uncharacterized protein n=1 Tax=Streptomyces albipurpureus TaxID=2897419 RepID=A0ABT0UMF5_9ACTN|nr:hypothetical protein [Streptomyces sp. CWNU-1]MCM2389809.1 hypothetical protein [Streptomyces sp. CWNU-1]